MTAFENSSICPPIRSGSTRDLSLKTDVSADVGQPQAPASIENDMAEGRAAGVSGTPAFFIYGIFLNGAQPASAFEDMIEEELLRSSRNVAK
jgi:protein-disulfide isomerase